MILETNQIILYPFFDRNVQLLFIRAWQQNDLSQPLWCPNGISIVPSRTFFFWKNGQKSLVQTKALK